MKKIILVLIFIITFLILLNSSTIVNNILLSFNICFNNLFPSLIPFMFLSHILIKYNFVDEISRLFKRLSTKIFNVNKIASFAIIMSMISGTPSNSKYLKDLYDNNLINIDDINKCIKFCHFTNPIFIINTIGITFLNNKKLGILILISHYISSFIIGIIFKNDKCDYIDKNYQYNKINKKNFITILNESIINTSSTLLLILGIITFCLIITGLLDSIIYINSDYKYIYGLLEITQGLKYLCISNININLKAIISCFLISFGGICIHIQVFSILDNKKIRYIPYFLSRLLHAILSSLICYLFLLFL